MRSPRETEQNLSRLVACGTPCPDSPALCYSEELGEDSLACRRRAAYSLVHLASKIPEHLAVRAKRFMSTVNGIVSQQPAFDELTRETLSMARTGAISESEKIAVAECLVTLALAQARPPSSPPRAAEQLVAFSRSLLEEPMSALRSEALSPFVRGRPTLALALLGLHAEDLRAAESTDGRAAHTTGPRKVRSKVNSFVLVLPC